MDIYDISLIYDMVRGTTYFKCPHCGKVFKAPDIEHNGTIYTMPQPCPVCGTKSSRVGILGIIQSFLARPKDAGKDKQTA